eukprot:TRINITY_DN990_c0_g1_i2.p1 TRINITY_DN990_c0_g1~~TRINITY_DN990_c0_g1_i2.p1  ORF type:complete len:190 (-),score=50.33 TRINITY_DN990_c0_g1_i2:172-741(-)
MVRCHRRFLLINLVLLFYQFITLSLYCFFFFFFNDTATTEIYTLHIVGSVRCVQETDIGFGELNKYTSKFDKVLQELDIEYFGSPLVKAFFDEYMGQITKNYSQTKNIYDYDSLFTNQVQANTKSLEQLISDKTDEQKHYQIHRYKELKSVDFVDSMMLGEKIYEMTQKLNLEGELLEKSEEIISILNN